MMLLTWIDNNLIVLGLAAVLAGIALGALWSRHQAGHAALATSEGRAGRTTGERKPGRATGSPASSAVSGVATSSRPGR